MYVTYNSSLTACLRARNVHAYLPTVYVYVYVSHVCMWNHGLSLDGSTPLISAHFPTVGTSIIQAVLAQLPVTLSTYVIKDNSMSYTYGKSDAEQMYAWCTKHVNLILVRMKSLIVVTLDIVWEWDHSCRTQTLCTLWNILNTGAAKWHKNLLTWELSRL